MTVEQKYFIRLLRDYVHQDQSENPAYVLDWKLITTYAREQNLAGIIYHQVRDFPALTPVASRKLKEGFFSDVYLSVNTDYEFGKVIELFERDGIESLPFKGVLFRNYYPQPELRTMGDRDILIHHKDRLTSDEAILSLGYSKFVDNHAVWTYYDKKLMFEIHDVMFYENLTNQIDYREYFSKIWDSARKDSDCPQSLRYIPDPNMHFLYSMAHTAKHVVNKGMGFRAFLDMVFFVKNADSQGEDPDWIWIKGELKKLELYEFTKTCFSLCEKWFEVAMPFHQEGLDPVFIDEVSEKIFRDGIFGLKNEDNIASNSAKEIRRSKQPYRYTAFKLTIHKLFPPYRDMQLIPWYAWVDGKPWLMPAAWVYRWFYCIKNKWDHSRNLLLEPFEKKETIEARQQYLDRWGL